MTSHDGCRRQKGSSSSWDVIPDRNVVASIFGFVRANHGLVKMPFHELLMPCCFYHMHSQHGLTFPRRSLAEGDVIVADRRPWAAESRLQDGGCVSIPWDASICDL